MGNTFLVLVVIFSSSVFCSDFSLSLDLLGLTGFRSLSTQLEVCSSFNVYTNSRTHSKRTCGVNKNAIHSTKLYKHTHTHTRVRVSVHLGRFSNRIIRNRDHAHTANENAWLFVAFPISHFPQFTFPLYRRIGVAKLWKSLSVRLFLSSLNAAVRVSSVLLSTHSAQNPERSHQRNAEKSAHKARRKRQLSRAHSQIRA